MTNQRFDRLHVSASDGKVKRRLAVIIHRAGRQAHFEQAFKCRGLPVTRRPADDLNVTRSATLREFRLTGEQ